MTSTPPKAAKHEPTGAPRRVVREKPLILLVDDYPDSDDEPG